MTHTIVRSTLSGNSYGLTGSFVIRPLVSVRMAYSLSEAMPTSEEGNMAFKIEEQLEANVMVYLDCHGFNGSKEWSTTLHTASRVPLSGRIAKPVDQSGAYTSAKKENQKKFRIRIKALMAEIAKREAVQANAPLIEGTDTMSNVNGNVELLKARINNLLTVASKKPLIELMPIDSVMDTLAKLNLDLLADEDWTEINKKLLTAVHDGYEII